MTEHEIIAENKRLKKEVEDKERAYNDEFCLRKEWQTKYQELLKEKSETIKEFAEKIKRKATIVRTTHSGIHYYEIDDNEIDSIIKENGVEK